MRKNDTAIISLMDIAVALVLLTRLPLPALPDAAFTRQARATWAFPLAGLAVGTIAAITGWGALALGLPAAAAAGLILTVQIIVTGAMHEDGLADTFDGLWGGWSRERRLIIMKDSAIGTYGVLALVLSLGLRWVALSALIPLGFGVVVAAAVLSRGVLPIIMATLPPARDTGLSHSVGAPDRKAAVIALGLGAGLAVLAAGSWIILPMAVAYAAVFGLTQIARVKIGGQTGDILGASQQIAEIVVLLALASRVAH